MTTDTQTQGEGVVIKGPGRRPKEVVEDVLTGDDVKEMLQRSINTSEATLRRMESETLSLRREMNEVVRSVEVSMQSKISEELGKDYESLCWSRKVGHDIDRSALGNAKAVFSVGGTAAGWGALGWLLYRTLRPV